MSDEQRKDTQDERSRGLSRRAILALAVVYCFAVWTGIAIGALAVIDAFRR
jgi:hypothetical protein